MRQLWTQQALRMDTQIRFQVVSDGASQAEVAEAIDRALDAFASVETACSRFDPTSEVMGLTEHVGQAIRVSPTLFESVRFALTVAEMTDGLFDPTIGRALEKHGFNRHYLSGETVDTAAVDGSVATFRDVVVDEGDRTIRLLRPLVLDLGAVAKGLAIDLAAQSLSQFEGFLIDAGGDILVHGTNVQGDPWRIGIRHPLQLEAVYCNVELPTNTSICTSGDYLRRSPIDQSVHHILNPQSGTSANTLISCSVIAPYAMMADALSTAAFVMGPQAGIEMLDACQVEGLLLTSNLDRYTTQNIGGYIHE